MRSSTSSLILSMLPSGGYTWNQYAFERGIILCRYSFSASTDFPLILSTTGLSRSPLIGPMPMSTLSKPLWISGMMAGVSPFVKSSSSASNIFLFNWAVVIWNGFIFKFLMGELRYFLTQILSMKSKWKQPKRSEKAYNHRYTVFHNPYAKMSGRIPLKMKANFPVSVIFKASHPLFLDSLSPRYHCYMANFRFYPNVEMRSPRPSNIPAWKAHKKPIHFAVL